MLVIDDEERVGRAIARVLDEHQVETCTSAPEALRLAAEGRRWDVLLCDLVMPTMTGMELAARIEREAPELARRLVFMTGGAFTPGSFEFLHGPKGRTFVEKPVDVDRLRELVASVASLP